MCSELFRIPYEWNGVPIFGVGVLLAIWALVSASTLIGLLRRYGLSRETWSAVPVLLLTGAATRDPRQFDDADAFDIERPPAVSLGFGHGVHSCLGAALARMESRVAIEELARRWSRLEVDESGLQRVHMSNVAGYSHVPVQAVRHAGS